MATVPPPSASNPSPPLRIIFMGTPALAAHILERLIRDGSENASVVGVVTRPDSAQGRGLTMRQSEFAAVTEQHGVPTLKPTNIRTSEFAQELASMRPDLLVVAAYGRILPKSILDVPRIMPINVHASLLPRHRGASPVETAILAGDSVTGVTIMRVTEGMDAGPMLLKAEVPIAADETTWTLKTKLAEAGATALLGELAKIRAGTIHEQPQDDSQATFTKPITKQDAKID